MQFDQRKNSANRAKHGVGFEEVVAFDWRTALIRPDARWDYGEPRFIAYGFLKDRLHVLIFTLRDDETLRPISFRKANPRERKFYEKETA